MEILLFSLHRRGLFDPAVMVHTSVHPRDAQFLIGSLAEPLGIPERINAPPRLDHPNFIPIPFAAGADIIIGTVKMKVRKQQTIYM